LEAVYPCSEYVGGLKSLRLQRVRKNLSLIWNLIFTTTMSDTSPTDPELARLVADMSVMRTPATQHTNGGLRACAQANDQGTLSDVDSTVMGQVVTVLLNAKGKEGMPMEIDTGSMQVLDVLMQSTTGQRFRVFVAPGSNHGFDDYCFQLIGQGVSFCTKCNCGMAHHHASVKTVNPVEIYAAKGTTTAFVPPALTPLAIDQEVMEEWKSLTLTLPD
jgi:hypothetical protein